MIPFGIFFPPLFLIGGSVVLMWGPVFLIDTKKCVKCFRCGHKFRSAELAKIDQKIGQQIHKEALKGAITEGYEGFDTPF